MKRWTFLFRPQWLALFVVVLAFAWPSQGSFLHYGTDKDAAKASIAALTKLLDDTMRAMGGRGRLHVIAHGRLSPSVPVADATVEQIGEWMSGLWHKDVQDHLQRTELEAAHAEA